ncbi:UDP:flavonoid glycosyltransferase YjiC, YdhE family [Streptomyces misionensis]|uniref:UDP:flavonoid glycosyltransferase YjiC, YdhE family n=1 Tax=Streptomyces misionensis TaxID=67331 RepID=A0A1H4IAE1_9ACTN|nr:nucleotide disphospho-sugar-binding domain-containing protein [Streptomyces misionensis]SEB30885.1 UDP:flavonoid glycosyltransferase YjiC, YdhE family [Streptomyces misionensis]
MRVLFVVSDWFTHYAPMIPLGWALQSGGHEVRVVCPAGQAGPLADAGLTPVPVLGGLDMVTQTRLLYYWQAQGDNRPYPGMPLHPVTGEELASLDGFSYDAWFAEHKREIAGAVKANFTGTLAHAREWRADLVVHDPLSLEGLFAAKATGVPAVLHAWGPVGTDEQDPLLRLLPPDPAGFFPRHGLGEAGTHLVDHVVDPCPASLAPPTRAHRLPVRFVPYNGPGEMPEWVLEPPARPRVCVIWGASLTRMFGPRSFVVPDILRALAGLDAEVVLTGIPQDTAALGAVPAGVRVLERFPLRFLLPTCSAVVHHGGAGSTMTAVAAGVPQLALTFAPEQQANGVRLAATGAGAHLRGDLADPAAIRREVARLLDDPSFATAAARLREENAARPTPADLARTLAELAEAGSVAAAR